MGQVYRVLLAIGILALAGNAPAIMIHGNTGNPVDRQFSDLSHDVLTQIAAGEFSDTRREQKLARKVGKLLGKIDRFPLRAESGSLNARQERRLSRLEDRLLLILALMDLPELATLAPELTGPETTSAGGGLQDPDTGRGGVVENTVFRESGVGNDSGNAVPDPPALALLGIGLAVIGARCYLGKSA